MKHAFRWLIVVMVAIFVTPTAYSQTFGFKAGLNFSNMIYKPDGTGSSHNYKIHSGFHAGIITNIPFSKCVSLETDLYLSTKGINVEHKKYNGFSPDRGKINLLYIDIPMMVKFFLSQQSTKPYLVVGPYVGFGLSGKVTINDKSQSIHFGSAYDEDFKDLDFGGTLGAGLEMGSFLVGLNYDIGFINIYSHDDIHGKVYNRNFRISVGYIFPNRHSSIPKSHAGHGKKKNENWWQE